MKKNYITPEMEMVMFVQEDIITASNGIDVDDGDGNIDLPFVPAD